MRLTSFFYRTIVVLSLILISTALLPVSSAAATPESGGPWLLYDFSLGWGMGTGGKPGGVLFEVQISDGGPFTTAYKAIYSALRWHPYAIDLHKYSGKSITIRLVTEHVENRINMDYPYWGNPRIVVGALDGKAAPKLVKSLALTKADLTGGLLPDGTVIALNEEDPIFNVPNPGLLVTPAMTNREHMVTVYGGDNFITVPGKAQPGLYMGVSMGIDYLRIGAGPNMEDYTGPMPAKAFAQWKVDVPQAAAANKTAPVSKSVARPVSKAAKEFIELASREDKYLYQAGLLSAWDRQKLTLTANMGPSASYGWAFAGVETIGLDNPEFLVKKSGRYANSSENAFAGIVVDYHTASGYQKRVFFGLGAGSKARYDLRPGGWIFDDASMSRYQRLTFKTDFVDISSKLTSSQGRIKLAVKQHAPAGWDGRMWVTAAVQNQPVNTGITLQFLGIKPYIPNPVVKYVKDTVKPGSGMIALKRGRLTLAISRTNGALCGVWDNVTGLRLAEECSDAYTQERMKSIASSTERYDKVRNIQQSDDTVTIVCTNPAFEGMVITKLYTVKPSALFSKKVSFSTSDKEGFFIRYNSNTALASEFVSKTPGALAKRKVVAQGKVVEADETVAPEQAGAGAAPVMITRDSKVGIAGYRYRVNDRFVMRGQSSPTRAGWNLKVFADYLKTGQTVSGESQWVVFTGDLSTFNRHYRDLPENKKIFNTPKPEWTSRIISDAMYLQNGLEAFHKACEPWIVTGTIWFFNSPWGNWGSYHDYPNKMHPDVYGIAPAYRSSQPNARIGKYNNFAFDKTSDLFKQHPEYGVRDRELELLSSGINSDSSRGASFYFQILNPKVRKELIKMHTEQVRDWNFDFFYTDGPGYGQEEPDWGIMDVTQNYDWLEYCSQLKKALQNINPDCPWFVNGLLPNTDIGYIEYRDEQWKALGSKDWQIVARDLFNLKFNEPEGFLVVPTYGNAGADPEMSAYVFMYGWCGHGSDVNRLPWMKAALDFRGMRLVDDAVDPKWYKTGGNLEAYGFRKGKFGIVNLIDHEGVSRKPQVNINTAKLGISGKTYAWTLQMTNPYEDTPDPTDVSKSVRTWAKTACKPSIQFWGQKAPAKLTVNIPTKPKLTNSLILSPIPVVLDSVDGFKSETGLPTHPDVDISVKDISDGLLIYITCRAGSASLLVPGWDTRSSYISTSQQSSNTTWCELPAVKLSVSRGKHTVKMTKVKPVPKSVVYTMDFEDKDQKPWPDTHCPVKDSVRIVKTADNHALRVDSNSVWTYSRQTAVVNRVSAVNRYMVIDFKARVLRADANNSPAPVEFHLPENQSIATIDVQFTPTGKIRCMGNEVGEYQVANGVDDTGWIPIRLILDRKTNEIRSKVNGRVSSWKNPVPLGFWTNVQTMVCVPNGSGYGSIEYDDFKITTQEKL